jgi:YidC/Oxa1 family membrane protein insertase
MPILATNFIEDAFSPLIRLFESIMVFIHDNVVGGSWGLAIIGLTFVIRAALVPLTFRQLKSMQEMQRLAPQIQALKEKYKEDKQRQQQEIMKFYQAHKINPLASCLPLLMQLPVFISLFYMLRSDLKKHICGDQLVKYFNTHPKEALHYHVVGHVTNVAHLPAKFIEQTPCQTVAPGSAKFLFLPDITNRAFGAALIVLIVLYLGSQVASTLVATATADPKQRRLMLFLPVIFIVILYSYPAGLLVYWITTNLWTIGQQLLIKRHMGTPPVPAPGKGPDPGGGGGSPNGKTDAPPKGRAKGEPALAGVPARGGAGAPPPRPPRKKKKRSGRRR